MNRTTSERNEDHFLASISAKEKMDKQRNKRAKKRVDYALTEVLTVLQKPLPPANRIFAIFYFRLK